MKARGAGENEKYYVLLFISIYFLFYNASLVTIIVKAE